MNGIQYVLLWGTGFAATYLYLFRYDLHVTVTSLVGTAAWAALAMRGNRILWPSQGEVLALDGTGIVQAFCAFLALMSGFITVAHRTEAYPTDEMANQTQDIE
jgi:threonine/homoserine efflux transporter RhtA